MLSKRSPDPNFLSHCLGRFIADHPPTPLVDNHPSVNGPKSRLSLGSPSTDKDKNSVLPALDAT